MWPAWVCRWSPQEWQGGCQIRPPHSDDRCCAARGGEIVGVPDGGPFGDPNDKNGIYRLKRDGSFKLIADIGSWSVDNPPVPAFFVDTGVQYAMERYDGGFLVTDGHHNRVLWVKRNGSIKEVATFGNVVPTGLEVTKHRAFITQAGPIPHRPEDGKVLALGRGSNPTEVASGASMLIDVERDRTASYTHCRRGKGRCGRRPNRTPADW